MLIEDIINEPSVYKKIILIGLALGRDLHMQEGFQDGFQQGLQEGARCVVRLQLTQKFGPLSDATEARLSAATQDDPERWACQMLDANTLDEALS